MPNEVTVLFKNIALKGAADDGKGKFELVSTGDIKITADPTTILAMAEYLEEVAEHEN
jgi:hypothetical protein